MMADLDKLAHLSLISKICIELDNHYNLNDKDLGNSFHFPYLFNKNVNNFNLVITIVANI